MSAQTHLNNHRYKYFCDQNIEEGHFDVTFQFDNQQLFAHSFILWPTSKVFEKTLFGPLAHKGPIPVLRHSFEDFKEFLTFMYLGKCTITMENVMALVNLGEFYEVKLLKDQCDEFLTQSSTKIEKVLKVYESLKLYSLKNAMEKVMEFFAQNIVEILKTDEFLNVQKETILDIAKMKNLNAKQEEVFEAVCKWAEHNCPKDTVNKNEFLKNQLADVMPLIDFSIMDFNFLNNFVVRKGFLFPSFDALSDALCEAAGKAEVKKQRAKEERLKIVPKRKRIQITDRNRRKAYADICDPEIITAITVMLENKTSQNIISATNDCCQLNASVSPRVSTRPKFCLIRDPSGCIALKSYPHTNNFNPQCCQGYSKNQCSTCISNDNKLKMLIQNDHIIGPVIPVNGYFNPDGECKIKFV